MDAAQNFGVNPLSERSFKRGPQVPLFGNFYRKNKIMDTLRAFSIFLYGHIYFSFLYGHFFFTGEKRRLVLSTQTEVKSIGSAQV